MLNTTMVKFYYFIQISSALKKENLSIGSISIELIGIYKFRKQISGKPLPGARTLQLELFLENQWYQKSKASVFLMQWGQFIAHDVSLLRPDSIGKNHF